MPRDAGKAVPGPFSLRNEANAPSDRLDPRTDVHCVHLRHPSKRPCEPSTRQVEVDHDPTRDAERRKPLRVVFVAFGCNRG